MGRILLAAAILWNATVDASAATVTQVVNFNYASHGTAFTDFSQFDMPHEILDRVDVHIEGTATSDAYTFVNAGLRTATFTGTVRAGFFTFVQLPEVILSKAFTETLAAGQSDGGGNYASGPFGQSISFATPADLSRYIGVGTFGPDINRPFGLSSASSSDPLVTFTGQGGIGENIRGSETITYSYHSNPSPASLVMAAIGLSSVIGCYLCGLAKHA